MTFSFPAVNPDGSNIVLEVEYSVSGGYVPATWTDPGDSPEFEIESITDEDGEEVEVSEDLLEEIFAAAEKDMEDNKYSDYCP